MTTEVTNQKSYYEDFGYDFANLHLSQPMIS